MLYTGCIHDYAPSFFGEGFLIQCAILIPSHIGRVFLSKWLDNIPSYTGRVFLSKWLGNIPSYIGRVFLSKWLGNIPSYIGRVFLSKWLGNIHLILVVFSLFVDVHSSGIKSVILDQNIILFIVATLYDIFPYIFLVFYDKLCTSKLL